MKHALARGPAGDFIALLRFANAKLSVFCIVHKFVQLFFILDILNWLFPSNIRIRFFYAVLYRPLNDEIQCDQSNNAKSIHHRCNTSKFRFVELSIPYSLVKEQANLAQKAGYHAMVIPCLCCSRPILPAINKKSSDKSLRIFVVDGTGLEPVTSCTSSRCSTS